MKNLILLLTILQTAGGATPLDPSLAEGPYSELRMTYTRTFLRLRVLELRLQVDRPTQARLMELASAPASAGRTERMATAILDAERLVAQSVFLRNIGYQRFLDELVAGARCAMEAGIIDAAELQRVRSSAPGWYASIRERGIRTGDRATYHIDGTGMRTRLQAADGTVLVDQLDAGTWPRRTLLGGYLAPCSDFRDPLIRSLSG